MKNEPTDRPEADPKTDDAPPTETKPKRAPGGFFLSQTKLDGTGRLRCHRDGEEDPACPHCYPKGAA